MQITINRVKTLPQSFNSSIGQLLLICSQIGYRIFEYEHKKIVQKSHDLSGGGGSSKDNFGAKKGSHDFWTLPYCFFLNIKGGTREMQIFIKPILLEHIKIGLNQKDDPLSEFLRYRPDFLHLLTTSIGFITLSNMGSHSPPSLISGKNWWENFLNESIFSYKISHSTNSTQQIQ